MKANLQAYILVGTRLKAAQTQPGHQRQSPGLWPSFGKHQTKEK
jgi:hypothetical protein